MIVWHSVEILFIWPINTLLVGCLCLQVDRFASFAFEICAIMRSGSMQFGANIISFFLVIRGS